MTVSLQLITNQILKPPIRTTKLNITKDIAGQSKQLTVSESILMILNVLFKPGATKEVFLSFRNKIMELQHLTIDFSIFL